MKDLKEQLRASKATQGQTAQDVYRMQSAPFPSQAPDAPETEADGKALGAMRVARWEHQNAEFARLKAEANKKT